MCCCSAAWLKPLARGLESDGSASSVWFWSEWNGCGEGWPESGFDRVIGRLDLGDMFQSESSIVELIGTLSFYYSLIAEQTVVCRCKAVGKRS